MLAITGIDDAINFAELSCMTHSISCEVGVGWSTKCRFEAIQICGVVGPSHVTHHEVMK